MSAEVQIVKSAIPQISAAAQRVAELFRSMEVGHIVTYEMVNAAAGFDVRHKRGVVSTARKRVLADDSIHIATVYGAGYKRLSPQEAADTLSSDLARSRNAARKGVRKAQHINVLDIPTEHRPRFVAQATLCVLIGESTKSKSQAKLAAVASTQPENTAVLAQRMALEALKSE